MAAIIKAYTLRLCRSSFETCFVLPWECYSGRLVTPGPAPRVKLHTPLPLPGWVSGPKASPWGRKR
jgi:hypothetical protein